MFKTTHSRGFTIFFAVLVASLAISVGLAIYDVISRELLLSQTTAQSQLAIFAADAGAECALYWDNKYNGSSSAFSTSTASSEPTSGITCNGYDIASAPWTVVETSSSGVTSFTLLLNADLAGPCAVVTVTKTGDPAQTIVEALGRNTCSATGITRVERALRLTY